MNVTPPRACNKSHMYSTQMCLLQFYRNSVDNELLGGVGVGEGAVQGGQQLGVSEPAVVHSTGLF